ncbi:hypothetical protein NPIL_306771 [Nephila pilipes]|uniref:Uncharacterized protein n=1 Tax=Nephila pilipes TaxID=299642 RepID=A0A8X6T0M5_NEPPI|nr:hypothetical protein NPIL_306771 [Nephila pilipes]
MELLRWQSRSSFQRRNVIMFFGIVLLVVLIVTVIYHIKRTQNVCQFKKWTEENITKSETTDPPTQNKTLACTFQVITVILEGILTIGFGYFIFRRFTLFMQEYFQIAR